MLPATAWHLYQQAREAPVYIKLTHHMAYMQSTCKAAPPTFAHLHNNYLQLENWHLLSSRTSPFVLSSRSSGPLLSAITVSSSASGSMAQLVGIASLPGAWRRGTLYERKLVTHHFLYMTGSTYRKLATYSAHEHARYDRNSWVGRRSSSRKKGPVSCFAVQRLLSVPAFPGGIAASRVPNHHCKCRMTSIFWPPAKWY